MSNLVRLNNSMIVCDSLIVADKFSKRHSNVLRKIKSISNEYKAINGLKNEPLNFIKSTREYRGQSFNIYLMDKKAFSLLVMSFTGSKALIWKLKFIDAFFDMEKRLIQLEINKQSEQWSRLREQGKEIRKLETDTIKEFVEYAIKQGGKNAKFYYKHITLVTYKCLQLIQHKQPKLRETLNNMELNQLFMAETVAERAIKQYMSEGKHYKVIFELVKQDLEKLADSLFLLQGRKLYVKN